MGVITRDDGTLGWQDVPTGKVMGLREYIVGLSKRLRFNEALRLVDELSKEVAALQVAVRVQRKTFGAALKQAQGDAAEAKQQLHAARREPLNRINSINAD